MKLSEVAMH